MSSFAFLLMKKFSLNESLYISAPLNPIKKHGSKLFVLGDNLSTRPYTEGGYLEKENSNRSQTPLLPDVSDMNGNRKNSNIQPKNDRPKTCHQ